MSISSIYLATSFTVSGATRHDTLEGVSFINPNAAQARVNRAKKLAASRARLLAISAQSRSASAAGGGGGGGALPSAADEKEERKQQRMLRNRESAALSRKRKSDRIGELEIYVEALEEENRRLRRRINALELGNTNNRGTPAVVAPSARTSLPYLHQAELSTVCACRAPSSDSVITSVQANNAIRAAAGPSALSAMAASCFNISRPAVFA